MLESELGQVFGVGTMVEDSLPWLGQTQPVRSEVDHGSWSTCAFGHIDYI